jgi:hypothetical protein
VKIQKFIKAMQQTIEKLEYKYPELDFRTEKNYFNGLNQKLIN